MLFMSLPSPKRKGRQAVDGRKEVKAPQEITITDEMASEYNLGMLNQIRDLEPTYSVVARIRKRNIKGGNNIHIDSYLSGVGIPDATKLVFLWSSPDVIDSSIQGLLTWNIQYATKKLSGRDVVVPVVVEPFANEKDLDPTGVTIYGLHGFFLPRPKFPVPTGDDLFVPQVMAECDHGGYPPYSLSLKTLKKAAHGDYTIDVILTYKYHERLKQASGKVTFNISSWWDRNQWWIITAGSIVAFILLILSVVHDLFSISG